MLSAKHKTVIFVCTGNFYRSRFSEYLFNALAREKKLPWRATSRGLKTWTVAKSEGAISEFTAYRLTARGVAFDGQRFPIQLSGEDLQNADLVIALKKDEHYSMMRQQFPDWADRIEYWHIDDIDCATPDESLPICEACLASLVGLLAAEEEEASAQLQRAA